MQRVIPPDFEARVRSFQSSFSAGSYLSAWTTPIRERSQTLKDFPEFKAQKITTLRMEFREAIGTSQCAHIELVNDHDFGIVVKLRAPSNRCFSVWPPIGFVEARSSSQFFFCFDGRASSLPDDLSFGFTIYQWMVPALIGEAIVKEAKDQLSTHTARKVVNAQTSVKCANILWLPITLSTKFTFGRKCSHHHAEYVPRPVFGNDGHIMVAEAAYDPNKDDEQDEDLPTGDDGDK